jgi:hypothetical protein
MSGSGGSVVALVAVVAVEHLRCSTLLVVAVLAVDDGLL